MHIRHICVDSLLSPSITPHSLTPSLQLICFTYPSQTTTRAGSSMLNGLRF